MILTHLVFFEFIPGAGQFVEPPEPQPEVTQTPAGSKKRRRERYIARFEGLDYEFSTLEELEFFVAENSKPDKKLPAKAKAKPKSIKIKLTPEYKEELVSFTKVSDVELPKIDLMPVHEAMAKVKALEERYKTWKKRLMQDDEEILMLYDF